MPKSLFINPAVRQARTTLVLPPIPVNQYQGNVTTELQSKRFLTPQIAQRLYLDMYTARRFEEALLAIKLKSRLEVPGEEPIDFKNGGPAHLRINQEADAAGKVFLLKPDELIFGSHSSHEEIIAKGLAAIHQLDSAEALRRLQKCHGGELTDIVRSADGQAQMSGPVPEAIQALGIDANRNSAIQAFLYGLAAEIFCKTTGFNRGLGGSMHAFFLPLGIGPNNAIVGSSANISAGAAHANLVKNFMAESAQLSFNRAMFNVGDGAAARGPVRETLNWMGMAQIENLWNLGVKGLSLIGHFVDNGYGMGGQTTGETGSYKRLSQLFYGERPDGYHAETINGQDPLAVIDFYFRKFQELGETGAWPLGCHSETYRVTGHSPSDQSSYRTREEVEAWQAVDPIKMYKAQLIDALKGIGGFEDIEARIQAIEKYVDDNIYRSMRLASNPTISPPFGSAPNSVQVLEGYMFNTGTSEPEPPQVGRDILMPLEEHPHFVRVKAAYDKGPAMVNFRDALSLAIMQRFARDRRLVGYGEENRDWGGAFAVYRDFEKLLPYHRLFNAPISEGTIIGSAVGVAMNGLRALVESMYSDFLGCGGEELINQLAKWQSMSAGEIRLPVGVRVSVGSAYGAQHSQDLTSMLYGIPGLYMAYPATPFDAKTMMTALLGQDNPFIFTESQKSYDKNMTATQMKEKFGLNIEPPPFDEIGCVIGEPELVRTGKDFTLLAFGPALYTAGLAAMRLEQEFGLSADVVNGKWFVPFNFNPVVDSIRKTHKIVLISEATERGSAIQSMVADIARTAFDELDGIGVVGAPNTINMGWSGQHLFFPSVATILDEIHANIWPLKGYTPETDRSPEALMARRARGV